MKRLPRRICLLGGLLRTLYYRRVDILGTPCRDRPTLYLLSHRNGAIDGFVYQKALGDTPSLISVQLLRGPLRLLFDGIPVVRGKDRARYGIPADAVAAPVAAAIAQLRAGGSLALYPEGTSDWGYRPLPYHSGMAVIVARLRAAGADFVVQPAAAYYSKPDGFRSRASLNMGAPFTPQSESVAELQNELAAALDAVSVNCADAAHFNQVQHAAWQAAQQGEDYGAAFLRAQRANHLANIGCRTLPCPVEGRSAPVAESPTIAKPPADLSPPPVGEGQGRGSKPPAPATPQTATFTYTMSAQVYVNRFATLALCLTCPLIVAGACLAARAADGRNNTSFFRILGGMAGALLFALIWLAFPLLKPLNQHWLHSHADALLAALDSRLWGGKPLPAWFHYEAHPALTDLLAACYFAFFPIVIGGVAYYAWRRREPSAARFYNGLIGIYLAGLAGYLLLPAAGPAFTTLPDQGAGGILAPAVIAIVKDGVTGMDVFPSLHTALTLYITAFLWRDGKRKTALLLAPVTAGTIAATIWLRYHYGVDDLAGLALALAALYGSREKTG